MGTPQFPDLGKHCSVDICKQIDFLPFTCDRCRMVFCLEHRGYIKHNCPKADYQGVTVVICPLCAKGVRLIPDEDPNISWETHVNTECDPSNYEKVTKKKKCPVPGCREALTFSNTIKCRDCASDHCLKHRFGPDHKCPGPKKPESAFPFKNLLTFSKKDNPSSNRAPVASSSSSWTSSFLSAASSVKAKAEASMTKLGSEFSQALQIGQNSNDGSGNGGGNGNGLVEECPQCEAKFRTVSGLIEHVEKIHERRGVRNLAIDVCPKCSRGFRDAVALVQHIEREHRGSSKA